jgi:hypothetical protein
MTVISGLFYGLRTAVAVCGVSTRRVCFLNKGSKLSKRLIMLGAWSTTKIPLSSSSVRNGISVHALAFLYDLAELLLCVFYRKGFKPYGRDEKFIKGPIPLIISENRNQPG